MFDKLEEVVDRFREVEGLLSTPAATANQEKFRALTREHADLAQIVEKFEAYKKIGEDISGNRELLRDSDPEMREMARTELPGLEARRELLAQELKLLLLPKDPLDEKNIILEVRAGTGGEEASLFAAELFRMYSRYADRRRWRVEVLSAAETDSGGFKEVIALISGEKVYSRLKFEIGTHRVQRVPDTEAQGRIHTSACTVAVLPEAEDVDVEVDPSDLRIDVYRASGAGGQHVNKTESAVRIIHLPTGVTVQCQDEKSQLKNRDKAMRVLRAKLLELAQASQQAEVAETRKSQVGTGDRSERIRTYNFPQGRVTDHRIGLTLHKLDFILNGDLDELVDALITADQSERLRQVD